MNQELEQKCRYLLNRGRVSKQECVDILSILDERISEATYWKAVAEKALSENGELKAEVARLNQIARY
jgi:hypothetical protein